MVSRRDFLTTLTTGLGSIAVGPLLAATDGPAIETRLNGPIGLQLWSLREYLPKDLGGTLSKVRAMGFRDVEGAGLWGHSVADMRAALDAAGLRCTSAHMGYERLRDDLAGAIAEARAMGAAAIVCPWIDHGTAFTHDDVLKAAETFNKAGTGLAAAGMRLGYHCHGYEFVPSPDGTLFDTLAAATDPKRVTFQVDVFHAFLGGADPAALITRYAPRVTSLHLKDLKKGWAVTPGTSVAPADADVPVGSGEIDMPAVLRAAVKAGVPAYFLEDESADPLTHIPQSLDYLRAVRL